METIEEVKLGTGRQFVITTIGSNGTLIKKRKIYFIVKNIKIRDYKFFMLFNQNGGLVESVFAYVNIYKEFLAESTRESYIFQLKQLYEFAGIINKPIKKFSRKDYNKFYIFLRGFDATQSLTNNLYMYSTKGEETIESVLNTCRDYLKYCNNPSLKHMPQKNIKLPDVLHTKNKSVLCPKFISINQMAQIHNYVINDASINEETKIKYDLIYQLMFNTGMRIGEVQGLTLEDFEYYYNDEGERIYIIYIRNRLSDNNDQHAKRCLNVNNIKQYKSISYNSFNIGYQTVHIGESFYNQIIDYVDMASARFKQNNLSLAKADAVSFDKDNFYIFHNYKKNTPLNRDILSEYTKTMFRNLGIEVDSGKRRNNLLHRFRHGYCMYLLYVKKMNPSDACKLTRHANELSLAIYNNPTPEMIAEVMVDIQEGIYEYYDKKQKNN